MTLSVAIGVAQGVAVTYVMSHHLGLVTFGQLGLIISCTSVVLFASGSAVVNVLRESARARFESSMLVTAMLTQSLLSIPILLAALGVLYVVSAEPSLLGPAAILGVALLLRSALGPLVGFQLGRERMEWQLLDTAQAVLAFGALLGLVALGMKLYALPLATLVGTIAVAAFATLAWGHRIPVGSLKPQWAAARALFVSTLLWSGANLAQQLHWSLEPLLAPTVMDRTQVGLFIAGGRLLPGIRSLAAALGVVFLPRFIRAIEGGDMRELSERATQALRYIVPGALALTAALYVSAPWIVMLLYPSDFREATAIVRCLSLNVTAMFLHWHALCLLFAADKLRALLAGYGIGLIARLVLGASLGSAYGATGLAAAEVLSDWTLALTLHVITLYTLYPSRSMR